jgi:hypothetical protein
MFGILLMIRTLISILVSPKNQCTLSVSHCFIHNFHCAQFFSNANLADGTGIPSTNQLTSGSGNPTYSTGGRQLRLVPHQLSELRVTEIPRKNIKVLKLLNDGSFGTVSFMQPD